jgi:hypothetical protein
MHKKLTENREVIKDKRFSSKQWSNTLSEKIIPEKEVQNLVSEEPGVELVARFFLLKSSSSRKMFFSVQESVNENKKVKKYL